MLLVAVLFAGLVSVVAGSNMSNGKLKWNYTTGGKVGDPAVSNGVVYVGSDDRNIYALSATTGAKLWNYTTGDFVASSPAVSNGVVYVGSGDGNVYAIGNSSGGSLIPGFEVAFAVVGLAVAAYVVSRRR